MTGYDGIIARLKLALADPKVKGVLFDNDTPGGEVAGCFDACREIRRLRLLHNKPVGALAYDMNASAGMAIASAADRRYITQTAIAGSVGVVTAHTNWEAYLKNEGIDVTLIFSGAHKVDGNPYSALPADVLADVQASMDKLRNEFAALVSELTGLSLEAVLATEARCYRGQEAIDVGFADELVNGNEAISVFAEFVESSNSTRVTTLSTGASRMSTQTDQPEAAPAATTTTTTAAAPVTGADAAGTKAAERARISAILNSEAAQGRSKLANRLAMETDLTAEQAIALLESAEKESASGSSPLDRAMSSTTRPVIGAEAAGGNQNELDRVMGNYHAATGQPK
jgi:ClpP class serine protease